MPDELAEHLDALARDECYRVATVLKDSAYETTQCVFFVGANGAEQGPYVRKYLDSDAGLGTAYERIWKAQRAGRRFLHLPRIVDCYTTGEQRAVVMEYVQGETLADVVYRCDPSFALACDVFPRLCEAVIELHDGFDPPIIHRDLKPSNIMLSKDSLTIIDFGISRSFNDAADEDTRHFGTRAYAPPEQFGYGQTDVRSDVYALGMLLYFCLTEKTPDAKARRGDFVMPQIPDELRQVIARATAFDPAQRYANVAALRHAFNEAVSMPASCAAAPARVDALPSSFSDAHVCGPASGAKRRRFRIPLEVGIVWDVVVALTFILFFVVVTQMVISPKPDDISAAAPLALRAFLYYSLLLFVMGPFFYFVTDRRPLRRLIPALRSCSLLRDLVVCLVIFVIGILAVGISAQFFPPA